MDGLGEIGWGGTGHPYMCIEDKSDTLAVFRRTRCVMYVLSSCACFFLAMNLGRTSLNVFASQKQYSPFTSSVPIVHRGKTESSRSGR